MAHTLDVDGMLSSIRPEQFAEWEVEDRIDPWEIDLRAVSCVVAKVVNTLIQLQGADIKESDLLPHDWLIPKESDETEAPRVSSLAMMRAMIGV